MAWVGLTARVQGPALVVLAIWLVLGPVALAQKGRSGEGEETERPPEVDPYTEGDAAAMEQAGYVSFGPFRWGYRHDTAKIEDILGGVPVLWVETVHFKIGSSLEAYERPHDKDEKHKLKAELKRLRKRLPEVDARKTELDPWLRLHLLAQRMEELYASFCEHMNVSDADFLSARMIRDAKKNGGEGVAPPKFLLLVTEKKSSWARYAATVLGTKETITQRCLLPRTDSMLLGTSWEHLDGGAQNDTALHCTLVYGVTANLIDGFGGFTHNVPPWWQDGLSQWFSREVEPRWTTLVGSNVRDSQAKDHWHWEPKVRGRVQHDIVRPFVEMAQIMDRSEFDRADQMVMWSRIDYLVAEHSGAGLGTFLRALKAPMSRGSARAPVILARQEAAFVEAFGAGVEELDELWRKHVQRTYPRK